MARRKSGKKQTANQRAYQKELNRIKRFVRNAERRGYDFPVDIIPTMPKRVTKKALEKIQNTKPKQLYEKARFIDVETGELIKATEYRKEVRRQAARKAAETRRRRDEPTTVDIVVDAESMGVFSDIVIQNFKSYVLGFPDIISQQIMEWLNALIAREGKQAVAMMIENSAETLGDYLNRVGYDSEQGVLEYCTAMMNYLPNMTQEQKSSLMDAFESEIDYSEVF